MKKLKHSDSLASLLHLRRYGAPCTTSLQLQQSHHTSCRYSQPEDGKLRLCDSRRLRRSSISHLTCGCHSSTAPSVCGATSRSLPERRLGRTARPNLKV